MKQNTKNAESKIFYSVYLTVSCMIEKHRTTISSENSTAANLPITDSASQPITDLQEWD